MLTNHIKVVVAVLMAGLLFGCAESKPTLKVTSKPFSESMILAEMIAQLAENEGVPVERQIPYGTTAQIMEATKQGIVDLYPEYYGTSLIFLGQAPTSDGAQSTETVNKLFEPQGLRLGKGFGFSNDYVMAMTAEGAQELGVTKISDLTDSRDPITFTIDEDFLERPADGLQQMNRRYGITGSSHVAYPIGTERKDQQLSALRDRSVDVAELYATDGQIAEYGLVVLEDDQNFFPIYESMPLVRSEALDNTSVGLGGLDEWAEEGHTARFSLIRPATIASRTYPGQFRRVSSISTQFVLAGPVEKALITGDVGPGTAGTGEGGVAPISEDAVKAIRDAIGDSDLIDLSMPVHASLVPKN